jgi:hypothetical protein
LLQSLATTDTTRKIWTIKGQSFALALLGKPVCLQRFRLLYRISQHKLQAAVPLDSNLTITPSIVTNTFTNTFKVSPAVCDYLRKLFNKNSSPGEWEGRPVQFVHSYCTRAQVYNELITEQVNIDGNILTPSIDCFYKQWHKYFPFTWLTGETTCPHCYDYKERGILFHPKDSHGIFLSSYSIISKYLKSIYRMGSSKTKAR